MAFQTSSVVIPAVSSRSPAYLSGKAKVLGGPELRFPKSLREFPRLLKVAA